MQTSDCGAACLASVLGYYGRDVRVADLRESTNPGRDGLNAHSILTAAQQHGLRGRGLKVGVEDLSYLPRSAILHWEFSHFVVLDRVRRGGIDIVDPAMGRRFIPMDRVRRSFTGVALVLEPTETFERGATEKRRVWSYAKQILRQRHLISRVIVVSVVLRLFALALPILTGIVVDRVVPRGDYNLLWVVGAGLAAIVVFQFVSSLLRDHLMLQLRTNLDTRMSLGFVDYLVSLPYSFFQTRSSGDLMMRVNSNTTIREMLTSTTLTALLDGALVLAYLVLLFVFSFSIGVLVLALGVLQVSVFLLSRRRFGELMAMDLETQAQAQGYLVEMMGGIESLKVAGAEHRAVERWSNLFTDNLNVALQRGRLNAVVSSLVNTLHVAAPLLILSYGAALVVNGTFSLGTMLALNALAIGFLTPLGALVMSALQLQLLGSYVDRIEEVFQHEPEQQWDDVSQAPKLQGQITLENVSFRYTEESPVVVQDVSLDLEPGSCTAIVGRSGSGKSTLARLLLGLYWPTQGRVRYDGVDLSEYDVRSVRRQLGMVPQHPYIFGRSLAENIALAAPATTQDHIVAAAKVAAIHDEIIAMPMGYDTAAADGGAALSGGQRQRIALARAVVHRPRILLLDEATSSLDTSTENTVTSNLDSLQCTRIIIAHRLSTIIGADQIIVLEEGRIVDTGTHEQLIAREGVYRELVAAQTSLEDTTQS